MNPTHFPIIRVRKTPQGISASEEQAQSVTVAIVSERRATLMHGLLLPNSQ